jgi:hypothetical protein
MHACEQDKGPYPPSISIGEMADQEFYRVLLERHGEGYWEADW